MTEPESTDEALATDETSDVVEDAAAAEGDETE
jgi:hypothetical protein